MILAVEHLFYFYVVTINLDWGFFSYIILFLLHFFGEFVKWDLFFNVDAWLFILNFGFFAFLRSVWIAFFSVP